MDQYSLCHCMDIGTCDIVHWSAAPHHRIAYRTVLGVWVVLVLTVIRCSCHYVVDRILIHHDFHHDSCDYLWDFMAINYPLFYTWGFLYISSSGSANAQLPEYFRLWHSPWILDWTCFLLTPLCHVLYNIFYKGVPGFATDFPCGVWCRELTACPLYVGPLFGNLV